jgi:DNA replication and repair protein RecF
VVIRAVVEASGEDRDLRTYGSGGQQRTAAIALRLVEADTLREKLGRDPIYLLDDVFAELDRDRAARVVRLLDEGRSGQVLLTAPKPADVELRGGGLARWRIREGVVFTDG